MPPADILHPEDAVYLQRALELAALGVGRASPNPMVGCVIVKEGEIVGEGVHLYDAIEHAEGMALRMAGEKAFGADVYVTLEPCAHHGRTPPCAEALALARVKRVVVCMQDPDARVAGSGFDALLGHGIELRWGLMKEAAEQLNRAYLKQRTTGLPYVTLKVAASADGKIATASGDSRGLSSAQSNFLVHQLRATVDGIVIGSGTLRADNPRLTTRWADWEAHRIPMPASMIPLAPQVERTPTRVVLSASGAFKPPKFRLFADAREHPVIVVTKRSAPRETLAALDRRGVRILFARSTKSGLDLASALRALAAAGLNHLLIEGGGTLIASLIARGLWDELLKIESPRVLGGTDAPTWTEGPGVKRVAQGWPLRREAIAEVGPDLWVRYSP